jgi:hypothetical protein
MRFYDLDIDVKNYAKRIIDAGYKCPADINSVSDFVKGLKILNIWNAIDEIWLLRQQHNSGSGSSFYSLKNNSNNGTITSALWTFNGLFFGVNNADITMRGYKLKNSPLSIHLVENTNFSGYSGSGFYLGNHTAGSSYGKGFYAPGGNREYLAFRHGDSQGVNLGSTGINDNTFKSILISLTNKNTIEGYYRTTARSPVTNSAMDWDNQWNTNQDFRYQYTIGTNPNPTTSSIIIFNHNIIPLYLSYYSLYKSTIGKGLNLL